MMNSGFLILTLCLISNSNCQQLYNSRMTRPSLYDKYLKTTPTVKINPTAPVVKPYAVKTYPTVPLVQSYAVKTNPSKPIVQPYAIKTTPVAPIVKPNAVKTTPTVPIAQLYAIKTNPTVPIVEPYAIKTTPVAPIVKPNAVKTTPTVPIAQLYAIKTNPTVPIVQPYAIKLTPVAPIVKPNAVKTTPTVPIAQLYAIKTNPTVPIVQQYAIKTNQTAPIVQPYAVKINPPAPITIPTDTTNPTETIQQPNAVKKNSTEPIEQPNSVTSNSTEPTEPLNSVTSNSTEPTEPLNSVTSNATEPTELLNFVRTNSTASTEQQNTIEEQPYATRIPLAIDNPFGTLKPAYKGCNAVKFNYTSVVCQCDKTYCDFHDPGDDLREQMFLVVTTDEAGLRFDKRYMEPEPYRPFNTKEYPSCPDICTNKSASFVVDRSTQYQTINGFGTSFTDSSAIEILKLSKDLQDSLIASYFGKKGLDFNLARIPIGGTDQSDKPYTYQDTPVNDTKLSNFTFPYEENELKIPMILRSLNMSEQDVWLGASCWLPPAWMLHTEHEVKFLRNEHKQTYADYFVKFLKEYKKHGLDFWWVTPNNEPTNGFTNREFFGFASLPDETATYIVNTLGPTIQKDFPNTGIFLLDDERNYLNWVNPMVWNHPGILKYAKGIAMHWYSDADTTPKTLDDINYNQPNLPVLTTEMNAGLMDPVVVALGAWDRAQMYASLIIQEMNHWVTGWIDWMMALDGYGKPSWMSNYLDAAIIVVPENNTFYKQPMYYAFGQFSKYIKRGSRRINVSELTNSGVEYVAVLREDGRVVFVIHNTDYRAIGVDIRDEKRGVMKFTITPRSITTVVY